MIRYVLDTLADVGITRPIVVVSGDGTVEKTLGDTCIYAYQEEPLGSGDAVISARKASGDAKNLLILCGDSPLFRSSTIRELMEVHASAGAVVTLTSAVLENPSGYGRILRGASGEVRGVVEEKLASEQEKAIKEINGGSYAFDAAWLWENIHLMRKNEAGEYCLTEMVDLAISQGKRVATVSAKADEVLGINTPEQLREAEEVLRRREFPK